MQNMILKLNIYTKCIKTPRKIQNKILNKMIAISHFD